MVVKGIVLVLSPYQFRRGVDFWIRGQTVRCRLLGGLALGAGLLLVVLGLTVYSS
jgi:uncharacterized protein YjeT (DUF2065 family)